MTSSATSVERSPERRATLALVLWAVVAGLQLFTAFALGAGETGEHEQGDEPLYEYTLAIGSIFLYGVLVGVTFWIASLFPNRRAALGLRRFPPRALLLAAGIVIVSLILAAVLEPVLHASREQGLEPEQWRPEKAAPFLLNAVVIVTLVPFTEELFYRGLGVRALSIFGSVVAVVVSGLVFGLAHGILVALPVLGFFGLALAWLRLRTGSVWPCVIAHAAYNALGITAFFVTSTS